MGSSITERRYLRRAVSVTFRVREQDDVQSGELLFDTVDLSAGGAFLRSELLLEQGTIVVASFSLPGKDEPLQVKARVAWVARRREVKGETGMALEFLELDSKTRIVISQFVRSAVDV